MSQERVAAYLFRLTGAPVGEVIVLSSAQKAALVSWARREAVTLNTRHLKGSHVTLTGLFSSGMGEPLAETKAADQSLGGIGIDIESVETLPVADDYRTHPFYADNFAPSEIAHCLQSGDVKASFCGLWAAKEAIVKAGGGAPRDNRLGHIVVRHDKDGRPASELGTLSISHSGGLAVAVCVRVVSASADRMQAAATVPPQPRRGWPAGMVFALAVALATLFEMARSFLLG